MASKELIALASEAMEKRRKELIAQPLSRIYPQLAEAAADTILAALQDPTEVMNVAGCEADDPLGALVDWKGENCTPREGVARVWRAMLAHSPLGEKAE